MRDLWLFFTERKSSVTDQPDLWKRGQGILLECDGEKWVAEIVMTSKNGISLMIGFNGTIHGHLNSMPVMYDGKGIYRSIIDGTEVRFYHCRRTFSSD